MSVMSIFQNLMNSGAAPAAPAAPAATAAPSGGPGNGTVPNPANSGTTTPNSADPAALRAGKTGEGESPLANFNELWKIDDKNKQGEISLSPTFNIEPAKLAEAAKTLDFAKVVSPEVMAKALGGDSASLAAALNAVTQAAYTHSAVSTAKIVEAALAKQAQQFQQFLPNEVRRLQVSEQVRSDNPIFNNPAVAPMLDMLKDQLTAKFPAAPAAEISAQAQQFLSEFAKAVVTAGGGSITEKAAEGTGAAKGADYDWGNFFEPKA